MTEKDESGALPLFLQGRNLVLNEKSGVRGWQNCTKVPRNTYVLNFVLPEETKSVDENPWKRSAKVYDFVHHEGHDTGCEDIVLHVGVPGGPESLENIEMDIILGDFFELAPVCLGCRGEKSGIPREG